MDATSPTATPNLGAGPASVPRGDAALSALRAELDRLDDALHDLLIERASVVERVAAAGAKGRIALRPGREASIIRRLLARHNGPLPRQAIARIWRELFAATVGMQADHTVAVCESDPATHALTQLAREHFGALAPLRTHRTPSQALADLGSGAAAVAVLPMPTEAEPPRDAWWTALMRRQDPDARIRIVARLPFWSARPDGAPRAEALVACAIAPDPSGDDRALLGIELPQETSRARLSGALVAVGLRPESIVLRRDPGAEAALALVEVEGFVTDEDPRLTALAAAADRPPTVLGNYAVPIA